MTAKQALGPASDHSPASQEAGLVAFKEHLAASGADSFSGLSASERQSAGNQPAEQCSDVNRPFLVGTKPGTYKAFIWRPGCGQWKCKACGKALAVSWVHKIAYGVQAYMDDDGDTWSFVTITARGNRRGMTKSLEDFRKAWPKVTRRMKRHISGDLRYAAIPEQHKDGTVHMHLLMNRTFDAREYRKKDGSTAWRSRWLARNLTACGLGWSHDCRPLNDSNGAAVYAFKYATKQAGQADWPKSLRHVRTTHRWPVHNNGTKGKSDIDWTTVDPGKLFDVMADLLIKGYTFD